MNGHISTVDGAGVALAAIKGLNELLCEKDDQINTLRKDVTELKKALADQIAGENASEIEEFLNEFREQRAVAASKAGIQSR